MSNKSSNTKADIHFPSPCTARQELKDAMLEAVLTGVLDTRLQGHLERCESCRHELGALQARRIRMDAALPLIAAAEPQPGFHGRIIRAAGAGGQTTASRPRWFRVPPMRWAVAVPALTALVIMAALVTQRLRYKGPSREEIAAATQLATWQAPSDFLLQAPGQELLRDMPRLGETYFPIHVPITKERQK
jgi:predicted anti-sigma-YlaC factor YlaD